MNDSSVSGDFDLEIRGVRLCDDAVYQCQATANQLRSDNAVLSVLAPPDNPDIVGGAVQRVIENREVTLKCVANKGKPAAEVTLHSGDEFLRRLFERSAIDHSRCVGKAPTDASSTRRVTTRA